MHSPSLKDVVDWSNLVSAFRAAARGKRHREVVAQFEVNLGTELLSLHDELATQRYEPRPYRHFVVHEAKRRVISAAHFRDRVVHHALGYIRYVDDFALFSNTKSELWRAKRTVCERLESYRLKIHSEQAQVFPTTKGVPWLGCVVWPSHRRIKARKVRHFTRRLRDRIRAYLEGQISFAELQATVEGFSAHAAHTDSHGLIPHILETVGWQRVHS